MVHPLFNRDINPPRCAFTVAVMIIVVPIIGIMAAVVLPQYAESVAHLRRDAADLNLVRQNAITKSGVAQGDCAKFFASPDSCQLISDADLDHSTQEYAVDSANTPYPVDVVSVTFSSATGYASNSTITYDMYGSATSGDSPSFPDAPGVTGEISVAWGSEQRTAWSNPVTDDSVQSPTATATNSLKQFVMPGRERRAIP